VRPAAVQVEQLDEGHGPVGVAVEQIALGLGAVGPDHGDVAAVVERLLDDLGEGQRRSDLRHPALERGAVRHAALLLRTAR